MKNLLITVSAIIVCLVGAVVGISFFKGNSVAAWWAGAFTGMISNFLFMLGSARNEP